MTADPLHGFDPLGTSDDNVEIQKILDASSRRIIQNILKSYTGFFDVFSESIQNALDAIEKKSRIICVDIKGS